MKKICLIVCIFISVSLFAERSVTDMSGRVVSLPDNINKVFTANPVSSIFLYTVDPSLMVCWNTKLSPEAKNVLDSRVVKLKNFGVLYGNGKSANEEEVLKTGSDFILLMSNRDDNLSLKADEISKRLNTPVVVLYSDLDYISQAYDIMGAICNITDRTDKLSDYAEKVISRAEKLTNELPDSSKPLVYYSLDNSGLKTYSQGSSNTALIKLCGGENVINIPSSKKFGTMTITFEELLLNSPNIILAGSYPSREMRDGSIFDDKHWAMLDAEVSVIPRDPFNIFDKPPSVNRLAGIIWLQGELFPDLVEYDVESELTEFRKLFYHL